MRVQLGQSAALYCRVSSADQTCSRQELDLCAFAKKAGYKVVGVWKETASGAKNDRAERNKVLALARLSQLNDDLAFFRGVARDKAHICNGRFQKPLR